MALSSSPMPSLNVTLERFISNLGNGYCESFNSCFRDELLNQEWFCTLNEVHVLV